MDSKKYITTHYKLMCVGSTAALHGCNAKQVLTHVNGSRGSRGNDSSCGGRCSRGRRCSRGSRGRFN